MPSPADLSGPLTFEPIFMERIWGGRRLEKEFGKKLPPGKAVGESWEIVDRPEAQSVVASGSRRGKTLHDLWTQDRQSIFGAIAESERFPLLIKLLDAREKLSLQVHPPEDIAKILGGESKTEFWYVAAAEPEAELFVGLHGPTTREEFKRALDQNNVADYVHRIPVKAGDAMFLPAGRFHAIGGGNLLVEILQNSDTTYRVFDWGRSDEQGQSRPLHVDQALQSIDLNDAEPKLIEARGEVLIAHSLFEIQKWDLRVAREITRPGQMAIVCCLTGSIRCGDVDLAPGQFCLVPASLQDRQVHPRGAGATLLRVTIPRR